ncbi:uncharacterized protein LOC126295326 isoform X3 [Schistocerca gregaria]|uniref:uncharacterized protein LOC126295326 isoform X3 n=1 Tax=Schistocerca gregaria TaxID=7010 RepID=UPI00211F22DC|nr:uncharacterized protein LOC126295326 isoform X3 [Schistocerca gregaria]
MISANVLHAWSASKSGRNLLDVKVMLSPCKVHLLYVWVLLLCHNAWHVASLNGGKEVDNAIIKIIGGEKAADVWVPRFVFNHKTICAGVTLTAEADLTSATCLDDDEPLEAFVVVESHGQNEPPVQVAHIDRCVKFDKEQQQVHDLVVCFHRCQWNFSRDIFVPGVNLENDGVASEFDEQCSVMGFGHVTPEGDKCNILHTMEIQMGTPQDCGSHNDSVQNYVCGATAEQQESCVVNSGEPLLCRHNSSKFRIRGICKQEDCSAPQKYSKFLLLSYYREWLERTVPGLAPYSGPQAELGDPKLEGSAVDVTPEQKHQKTNRAEEEGEKCPVLAHPPPVHVHGHLPIEEADFGRAVPPTSDRTSQSSTTPNSLHSGDGDAREIQNSSRAVGQPISSADMPPTDRQDYPGNAQFASVSGAVPEPDLLEVPAGDVGSNSNATFSAAAGVTPSGVSHPVPSVSPEMGSRNIADDTSREQSLPNSVKESHSDNHNTPRADNQVSLADNPTQLSTEDPASVIPQDPVDSVSNITVLLTSLADGWYLTNATNSVPHLSGNNVTVDLDRLEKVISENGALLNFSYVVDSSNLPLPGYRNRSIEIVAKLHSSAGNELAKSSVDSPNSILSNQMKLPGMKSLDTIEKSGQITTDSFKPQNVLTSDGETPIQETDNEILGNSPDTDGPHDGASSSVAQLQHLSTDPPRASANGRPGAPNTLPLTPSQWDWLKQNAMRIPKNPLKNPKMLGKTLLKQPHRKYDTLTRERFAEEYGHRGTKQVTLDSESSGFPDAYRQKWSAQVMSYSHLHPSSYGAEEHGKIVKHDPSHTPTNGVLKSGISRRSVHDKSLRPKSDVLHVTPSGFRDGPDGSRPRRTLTDKETHSGEADTQIRGNVFAREGLPRDVRRGHPTFGSPSQTGEMKERGHSSPSENRRQPEGTFFGVASSSAKNRLKRSSEYDGERDENAVWNTLLADLANWPASVGIAPSELTPPVSFLTSVNESYPHTVSGPPRRSFYWYFKLLRAFMPGGNVARRIDLYKKKLIWGPPITYDEFSPLKPLNRDVEDDEQNRADEGADGIQHRAADENTTTTEVPENRQFGGPDGLAPGTVAYEHIPRQVREVKNDFLTTPGAGIQHRTDVDFVSTELGVKDESRTAGNRTESYSGSAKGADVSDRTDSGISVGAVDVGKETTLPTVDTQKETTLRTVDTRKETALPTVDTRKETALPTVDTRKETVLPTVDTQKETVLPTVDTRKETALPTVDTRKETALPTVDIRKETALPTVNIRKETALPTVHTQKESALPTLDTQKATALPTVHTRKETAFPTVDTPRETTLFTVDTRKSSSVSTTDVQKEITVSSVDTQRETSVPTAAGQSSSQPTVSTSKLILWPTVKRRIEAADHSEEKYSASYTGADEEGDSENQNQEQAEFYDKIKQLGADDGTNAAQKVASIFGVAFTLVLMLISVPQI